MKLSSPDSINPLQPTSDEIAAEVDRRTGYISMSKLITKTRLVGNGGLNIRPDEIEFIHPKNISLLRLKHEMAKEWITGNPGEAIVLLWTNAVKEIDAYHPSGIVNPNGGGFCQDILAAYGQDNTFREIAQRHRKALETIKAILGNQPTFPLWIGGLPFYNPQKEWLSKGEIRTTIATACDFPREEVVLIKLSPPIWTIAPHGGSGMVYLKSQAAADRLLAQNKKIEFEGLDGKKYYATIRLPLAREQSQLTPTEKNPHSDEAW